MTYVHASWIAAMRQARFEEAWNIAQHILEGRDPKERDNSALPYHQRWVWDGHRFEGRHVVVRCYHGLGDTLQFCRFLPLLAARAASVTVEVQRSLVDLLTAADWPVSLVTFDEQQPIPSSEVDLEITELDFALRARPEISAPPYVKAPPAILPRGTVAICHLAGEWDAERSVPERLFAAICALSPCITLAPSLSHLPVLNPRGCPLNMAATAALVAEARLVITVDTMIAHLAGALGTPTWLLLKAQPDWRWPVVGSTCAWYPQMRLYRQVQPGDWDTVLARVAHDLSDYCEMDSRSLT